MQQNQGGDFADQRYLSRCDVRHVQSDGVQLQREELRERRVRIRPVGQQREGFPLTHPSSRKEQRVRGDSLLPTNHGIVDLTDPIKNFRHQIQLFAGIWPIREATIGHVTDVFGQLQCSVKSTLKKVLLDELRGLYYKTSWRDDGKI